MLRNITNCIIALKLYVTILPWESCEVTLRTGIDIKWTERYAKCLRVPRVVVGIKTIRIQYVHLCTTRWRVFVVIKSVVVRFFPLWVIPSLFPFNFFHTEFFFFTKKTVNRAVFSLRRNLFQGLFP